MDARVVIVGAGHAGGSAAALLRQYGHRGPVVLIGEEAAVPYQRPPLSKAYLKGEVDLESLKLRADAFYPEHDIALKPGAAVERIDREARRVVLRDGAAEPYDVLILATGSTARTLKVPGGELAGLHHLRSLPDAEGLKAVLRDGKRLAIVGGGYIGLEVAASARSLGAEAVVIEREARVLARVASHELSDFFTGYHRGRGVEFRLGREVAALESDGSGSVNGVRLDDGETLACNAVLVGVGGLACDDLARSAGLHCDAGVVVDAAARTSDPHIFAIGDMTRRPMPLYGGRMFRLESVPNALEQAKQAACAIVGRPPPAPEVPWFWSDQYELKLQIAGVPFDAAAKVLRGAPETHSFAVFHLKDDVVVAVEAVNAPAEFMGGKQLILSGRPVSPERLADRGVSMKQVAAG